jgi:hypothetical protein
MHGSLRLLAGVSLLMLTSCTDGGGSDSQSVMSTPSPASSTAAKGPRPDFVRVDLDPALATLPEQVTAGRHRSVPTRLECIGSLDETWMLIRWKQGANTLQDAARLLRPAGKPVVSVALQRSETRVVILKLDQHDKLLSRTDLSMHHGRWWPQRSLICSDG